MTKSTGFQWQGRDDKEDGSLGTRVHHIVKPYERNQSSQVTLVGFESDAGVRRNKGRVGAERSPDIIRHALANLAWHSEGSIRDAGNVHYDDDNLESGQKACANRIASALDHSKVITLGGGHEVAWASFLGLEQYLTEKRQRNGNCETTSSPPSIGILNFDAHFDLREFESDIEGIRPSSGTPFNQIYHRCVANQWPFNYACLGVSRASNTAALFKKADSYNVWYVEDKHLTASRQQTHINKLIEFIEGCDYLYLTIDLDVFPAATAPGVSAPAARGVSYETIAPFLELALEYKDKLIIADIAEYNPTYDVDGQTARLAARLCWEIASAMSDE